MTMTRRFGLAAAVALTLGACSLSDPEANSTTLNGSRPAKAGDLGTLTYRAVDLMLAETPAVPKDTPIVVSTISNVDDLNKADPLGNMVSDFVRTRLVQAGGNVSEMRLRNAVLFNRRNGEIALSRNVGAVIKPVNAAVIVTGTYGTSYTTVYVSLKMVSVADGRILAGADFVVPRSAEVDGLIRRRTAGY
jgi:hypothetical protein